MVDSNEDVDLVIQATDKATAVFRAMEQSVGDTMARVNKRLEGSAASSTRSFWQFADGTREAKDGWNNLLTSIESRGLDAAFDKLNLDKLFDKAAGKAIGGITEGGASDALADALSGGIKSIVLAGITKAFESAKGALLAGGAEAAGLAIPAAVAIGGGFLARWFITQYQKDQEMQMAEAAVPGVGMIGHPALARMEAERDEETARLDKIRDWRYANEYAAKSAGLPKVQSVLDRRAFEQQHAGEEWGARGALAGAMGMSPEAAAFQNMAFGKAARQGIRIPEFVKQFQSLYGQAAEMDKALQAKNRLADLEQKMWDADKAFNEIVGGRFEKAAAIAEKIKTPVQRVDDAWREITDAFNEGFLTADQAARAIAGAAGENATKKKKPGSSDGMPSGNDPFESRTATRAPGGIMANLPQIAQQQLAVQKEATAAAREAQVKQQAIADNTADLLKAIDALKGQFQMVQ